MSTIMTHMISFFPDRDLSLAVADGLVAGGASYLEVQFPFSDPTADGPAIQAACQSALESGFTIDQGFSFIAELRRRHNLPIFIMTYASLVFARGVSDFISAGCDAGATGFILPDLPPDYDEGAYEAARKLGAAMVPVIVTSMSEARLGLLEQLGSDYLYVALRSGTTGSRTSLSRDHLTFLDRLGRFGSRVMAGFGISDRGQVEALAPHVHAVVVGSAIVRTVSDVAARTAGLPTEESANAIRTAVAAQVAELTGSPPPGD